MVRKSQTRTDRHMETAGAGGNAWRIELEYVLSGSDYPGSRLCAIYANWYRQCDGVSNADDVVSLW